MPVAVEPAGAHEFDDAVAISLEDELMLDDHSADQPHGDIDFDDDAFDAALAENLDPRDEAAWRQDQADSVDWLADRSAPTEPTRSWSRVTPVPQQPAFAAQPAASMTPVPALPG